MIFRWFFARMMIMDTNGVKQLADLARIRIDDAEAEALTGEFASILAYMDQINEVTTTGGDAESAGKHRNVLRADEDVHKKGAHTDDLLGQAPDTKEGYVKVKRIL